MNNSVNISSNAIRFSLVDYFINNYNFNMFYVLSFKYLSDLVSSYAICKSNIANTHINNKSYSQSLKYDVLRELLK